MRWTRIKKWLPVGTLVAGWLAAIAVVALLIAAGRNAEIERAHRSSAAIAQIIEEQTVRTFQATSLTLGTIADTWELTRPPANDAGFRQLLQARLRDMPYLRALVVLGPDGRLLHDTGYPRLSGVSFADRPYFVLHRDDPELRRTVTGPYVSRSAGGGWFLAVSERLGRGPRLEGLALATVDPAFFERLYSRIQLGEENVIALFHRDGTLIARYPAGGAAIGTSFRELPLFATHLPRAESGTYVSEATDEIYPGRQIVAYRGVEGLPLVVRVSHSEHALLAAWRRTALAAGVAMAALTLLLAGLLVQQMRARHRREEQRARNLQADKLEAMGQLTGGIVHDFNNLLQVMVMNLDLALRDPARAASAALAARRAAEHASALIRRLLTFARRHPLEMRTAHLNSLLTDAHPLLAQAAGSRIELVLQLAGDLPPVLVDETQFEVALLNLVVNARDALAGRGRIVLRTQAVRGGGACLSVEDDGPGMSEATRRRALEPFFSTKGEAGTGLGLSQVYGFMQQIGGGLEIVSAPGKGTRVELRFPPRQGSASASRARSAP